MRKKSLDINKVRAALRKEIKRKEWFHRIKERLAHAGVPRSNFYVFLDGRRSMTKESMIKLLRTFQLNPKDYMV